MKVPEKRTKRLMIRFTKKERELLTLLAAKAEITPTDYVRTRTLDSSLAPNATAAPSVERKLLALALGRLGDIGSVLDEINQQAQVGERPFNRVIEPAIRRVIDASEAILRALGVQP